MKKYKLTNETKVINNSRGKITLYRIEALKDFGIVKKGYGGGFVQDESNLSHDGKCWVYQEACVFGKAKVYENAYVYGIARVFGKARVFGNAHVYGSAYVYKHSQVHENAWIYGPTQVYGNARVFGCAHVGNEKIDYDVYGVYFNDDDVINISKNNVNDKHMQKIYNFIKEKNIL